MRLQEVFWMLLCVTWTGCGDARKFSAVKSAKFFDEASAVGKQAARNAARAKAAVDRHAELLRAARGSSKKHV